MEAQARHPLLPIRTVDPRVDPPTLEREVLTRWRERDVFAESLRMRDGAEPWVYYEGPPTLNGPPGVHHVLSRVFKDVYLRYKTMRGYFVERRGSWDCHGLPVEIAVERELGITSKAEIEVYGIAEFNLRCREWVLAQLQDWCDITERIGFWLDLEHAYSTHDRDYIESLWWAVREIHDKGLLYEGHKVVPYCPRCETTLSSHEAALDYRDVVDNSLYVRMPVLERADACGYAPLQAGDELLIWTTVPWSLPANAAISAHPELTYVRASDGNPHHHPLVLAETRVSEVLGENAEILASFPGRALEGLRYAPPFDFIPAAEHGRRGHSVLVGDFVSSEDGSGLVHTVPAFGEEDQILGARNGLSVVNPVRPDGTYDERIGRYAGRFVRDTNEDLIEDLRARGRLLRADSYEHSLPHCWRCETALFYYAKPSWHIAMSRLRGHLLANNETIDWHPEHIKHGRFGAWLEGNVDWALSRERYWGAPLPIWRCRNGHIHVIGGFAELEALAGRELDDPHRPYVDDIELPCRECGSTMRRVPEVLDVWFDSGAVPFAQEHYPFAGEQRLAARFPAHYICEGQDQTRGWFYALLAVSTLLFGRAPFRSVVCLGLVLDQEGQKMSKSRGNAVDPATVIESEGADALRWYFLTAKQPWSGYRFSREAIGEGAKSFLRQLWRTYAFYVLYAQTNSQTITGDEDRAGDYAGASELDAWVLSRATATVTVARERLDSFDATAAGREIAELVDDLSNWYVRRSRRRFWDGDPQAFHTLRTCLLLLTKLLAPFCPFVADEIYDNLDGALASVHLCDFPADEDLPPRDESLEQAMKSAREVVRLGLNIRNRAKIKVRQPLAETLVAVNRSEQAALSPLCGLVCEELNVKQVRFLASVAELEGEVEQGERSHCVEHSGTRTVALRLTVDDELRREGLVREIVRAVQAARRRAGLAIDERIDLTLAGDATLLEAADVHRDYLGGETLALCLHLDDRTPKSMEHREQTTIEGLTLEVALCRHAYAQK